LADNTIIIFFGDHGEAHVRGKQFCYEEGLHIPLVVRWPKNFTAPKQIRPGLVDTRMIEAIDFTPTMLDIAGAAKPATMQGRIFLGDHAEPDREYAFGARDRCDETVFRLRTVRDEHFRYIHNFTPDRPFLQANAYKEQQYPVWNLLKELHAQGKLTPAQALLCQPTMPEEELYDLDADPYEIHNLASSDKPEHQSALKRLRQQVDEWIVRGDDQGRTMESAEVIKAATATKPKKPRKAQ
jgi:arylsulfatase A-like enzyme